MVLALECVRLSRTRQKLINSRPAGMHWSVWFCVDVAWPSARSLDRPNDLLGTGRHSQCTCFPASLSELTGQYSIYMSTIDYMIAAYGPYSASATGGNGLARDFLAGIAAMYSTPCK